MSNVPQTPNFKLYKPPFDRKAWHDYINKNFSTIDAVLTTYLDVGNIVGVWENSTSYLDGDRVIDPDVGQVFEAAQNNTSAASPTTFAEERIANPTYWTSLSVTARGLGAWQPGTLYQPNDFVVDGSIYAVCINTHTSTGSFANDIANWDYLIDLSVAVTLPSLTGKSLQVLRVNAGETAAEWTTAVNIASWLSGLVTPAAHLHLVADLSDASPDAKSFLQAANDAAMRVALGVPSIAGDTFTGAVSITGTTSTLLTLTQTEASAADGPVINLIRNSASPAANDEIGQITFTGKDSGGNDVIYALVDAIINSPTDTTEIGIARLVARRSGGTFTVFNVSGVGGAYFSDSTGGDKGTGTLNANGLYINGAPVGQTVAFSAHKNGTNQTAITSGAQVKVTFSTESFDTGSHFASSTWTPPAGKYRLSANIGWLNTNGVADEQLSALVFKNGAAHKVMRGNRNLAASTPSTFIDCIVEANGTDTFEIYVQKSGAGDGAISGNVVDTWCDGTAL